MRNSFSIGLIIGFLSIYSALSAQEMIPLTEDQERLVYTFYEESLVQDEPFGEIIGTLPVGLALQVEGMIDMSEVTGMFDIWYEVSFNYRNRNRYGLVSSRYIADFGLEGEKGELFLYQEIDSKTTALRVVKNKEILSTLSYERPEGEVQHPILWGNRGVDGWTNILAIPYYDSRCQAFSGKTYLAWNGSEIHYVGLSRNEENLYNDELWGAQPNIELIFPEDKNGKKGKILKVKKSPLMNEDWNMEEYGIIEWTDKGFVIIEE